jgi:serine phosphatase RsbU (regulator of sigma subunit)
VLAYYGIRRRLNTEIKLVAIFCILDYLLSITPETIDLGMRFTHWTLDPWLQSLTFSVAGMPITVHQALHTLLLLSLAYALMRYAVREGRKQTEIENELKSAREVQRVMIPEAIPQVPGYAIQGSYHPANEVGGDFFQIISLDTALDTAATLVIVGDVSGKGLKAAMNVALIIGTIRTLAEFESEPTRILAGLNRRLFGRMQGGFTTALLLKLDRSGHCTLANAGHLPPFLNANELTLNQSLPLGIDAEAEFEDQELILQKGDCLTLYTDGVPEARCKKGELYGFERTRALFSNSFSAESIAQAARDFGQEDDITVLTIEPIPVNESSLPEINDNSVSLAPT